MIVRARWPDAAHHRRGLEQATHANATRRVRPECFAPRPKSLHRSKAGSLVQDSLGCNRWFRSRNCREIGSRQIELSAEIVAMLLHPEALGIQASALCRIAQQMAAQRRLRNLRHIQLLHGGSRGARQAKPSGRAARAASMLTTGWPAAIQPCPAADPSIPSDTSTKSLYPACWRLRITLPDRPPVAQMRATGRPSAIARAEKKTARGTDLRAC